MACAIEFSRKVGPERPASWAALSTDHFASLIQGNNVLEAVQAAVRGPIAFIDDRESPITSFKSMA